MRLGGRPVIICPFLTTRATTETTSRYLAGYTEDDHTLRAVLRSEGLMVLCFGAPLIGRPNRLALCQ